MYNITHSFRESFVREMRGTVVNICDCSQMVYNVRLMGLWSVIESYECIIEGRAITVTHTHTKAHTHTYIHTYIHIHTRWLIKRFLAFLICVSSSPLLVHHNAPVHKALVFKNSFEKLWIREIVAPTRFPRFGPV